MVSIQPGNGPAVHADGTIVAGRTPKKPKPQQITWAPIAGPSATPFTGNSYDRVRDAMVETFGPFPIRLSIEHEPALIAMAAASREGGECYRLWAQALEKYRGLELVDVE